MSEIILKYRVVRATSLAYRKKPTLKSDVVGYLHEGDKVSIVKGWEKSCDGIVWYKLVSNKNRFYISSRYLERITPNYRKRVADNADKIYAEIISLGCKHGDGAHKLSALRKKKTVTCSTSVSIVLQESGMLESGKLISHTEAVGSTVAIRKKLTIPKALNGRKNLKDGTYTIKRIAKPFPSLPSKYKKKGIIYVYDSNLAIYAGNNTIYSCNNGSSQMRNGKYIADKMAKGYCFDSPILYVIIPND